MKHFDILADRIGEELLKRGVDAGTLKYCVKADLDGEGKYIDVYIAFNDDTLCRLSGGFAVAPLNPLRSTCFFGLDVL